MRAILPFLIFVLSLLSARSVAQGQLWNQRLDLNRVSIARSANGDVYTAGVLFTPAVIPFVSCHNAAGQLVYRKSSAIQYSAGTARVSEAHLFGTNLFFAITINSQWTRLIRFDTTTQTFANVLLQSQGSDLDVSSLALSVGTYCIVGERNSDGNDIIQVRSQSDDSVLREVVTTQNLSRAFQIGNYYYVIGTYYASGSRVVVRRVNAGSSSSYSLAAANSSSSFPLTGVVAGRNLFLISNYYNGVTTFNIFVVPFNVQTLTYGDSWEESDSFKESYVRSASALGSTGLLMALHDRAIGIDGNGQLSFEIPYPDFLDAVLSGTSASDAEGNVVCILERYAENRLFRYAPNGTILNRHVIGLPDSLISQVRLDEAGVARFTYAPRDISSGSAWWLGAVAQASLSLAGPYTVGGSNRTGTINIGGPAPAGGATFDMFSNNPAATVPTTVTIPEGQSSVNFTISTTAVAANAKPTINARYNGIVLQANFDLAAPLVQTVTATPQSQYGGLSRLGTVTLTGPAPTGGKVVTLTSSNTAKATVPTNVTVAAGATSANFTISSSPTLVNAASVITATTGAVSKTVFIAIVAPVFTNATLGATTLKGGNSTTMTLTIGSPAPSGYTVTLISGATTLVQLPSSYAIPANSTTASAPVLTSAVSSTTPVTLVAYRGPYIKVMTLTLTP